MRVVRMAPESREASGGDLFVGAIERQTLIAEDDAKELRLSVVTFLDGAVNKMHHHTFDQVLVITEGEGIVQVEGQPERRVSVGDVILFPAGERHWHGAIPGATMSHMTVSTPGTTTM